MITQYEEERKTLDRAIANLLPEYSVTKKNQKFDLARALNNEIYELRWRLYGLLCKDITALQSRIDKDPWQSDDLRDMRWFLALKKRACMTDMETLMREDLALPLK